MFEWGGSRTLPHGVLFDRLGGQGDGDGDFEAAFGAVGGRNLSAAEAA